MTPTPPPIDNTKGDLSQKKSSRKKDPKKNNVEVSEKEVEDTLIYLSTHMKSKKPSIIVRPPPSSPKPTKRVKMRSQAHTSKAIATSSPEVVRIFLEPEEEDRTHPQDFELRGSTHPELTPSFEKEFEKIPEDPQLQNMKGK